MVKYCVLGRSVRGKTACPAIPKVTTGGLPASHQSRRATCRGDSGKGFEVLNGFSEKRGLLGRIFVPRVRKTDVCGQDLLRVDAKPSMKSVYKGPNIESRTAQECYRQSNLHGYQHPMRTPPGSALRDRPASLFERRVEIV